MGSSQIKASVRAFFADHGLDARVMHRTQPERFGGLHWPEELYPQPRHRDRDLTVYLVFRDTPQSEANLVEVVAVPHDEESLSDLATAMGPHPKFSGKNAIDPSLEVVSKFRFSSIEEMKTSLLRKLKN